MCKCVNNEVNAPQRYLVLLVVDFSYRQEIVWSRLCIILSAPDGNNAALEVFRFYSNNGCVLTT